MKTSFSLWAILPLLLLYACQEVPNWDDVVLPTTPGGAGSTSTGTLLVKRETLSTADSIVEIFSYDANKKLVSHRVYEGDRVTGQFDETRRWFIRDGQNRIVQMKDSVSNAATGWDTFRVRINYNGSTNTLLSSIATWGSANKDSMVFIYTGDRISKVLRYNFNFGSSVYDAYGGYQFLYDANGNMNRYKEYDVSGTTPVLLQERIYIYDTKVSSLQLGADAILIGMAGGFSSNALETLTGSNNFLKVDINDLGASAIESHTMVYSYRSNSTPYTANLTLKEGPLTIGTATLTYTYQ